MTIAPVQAGRSRQRTGEGVTPTGVGPLPPVPPNQPTGRRTGKWRLSNWRLRWKLLIVLLVPLLTALGLGALRVSSQLQNASVYDKISDQIALASSLDEVLDQVEKEREQVTLFVTSGGTAGSPPGGTSTAQSDAAVLAFRQQAAKIGNVDQATQTAVTNATNAVNGLDSLRSFAKGTKFPEILVLGGYNQVIDTLVQSTQLVSTGAPDNRISQLANGLFDIRNAKKEYTLANAILMMTVTPVRGPDGVTTPGWQFLPGTESQLNAAEAEFETSINSYNDTVSPADRQMFEDTVTGPDVDTRAQLLALIQTRADGNLGPPPANLLSVQPTTVQQSGDGAATLLERAEEKLDDELQAVTSNLATQAKDQAIRDGGILAAALLIAFLVTLLVARSLVQSLRRLRSGALEVARTKLPQSVQRILADPDPIKASNKAVEPVPVFTADEIGEVARSFDVVHGQAVRLAAEQAVLRDNVNAIFINLSRRSQTLVERQLALIDRLEKDEQDPDQLANLFELDHLATRMRRNSESLLVLSGSGLAKRMSRPVPIGELVGAAVSEVEQYARIDVGAPPAASVLGRVVNDLIHLIAELLDNATSYSEPNTRVSVRIARTRSRELAIQITDRGVGMTEDDVRLANERLANPPDIDVGVTRRMGLYVVARLARRHNIRVKLRANEDIDGGTVALIVIPEDLVHRPGEEPGGSIGSLDNLSPITTSQPNQAGRSGILEPFTPDSELAGAASAAAGIAGAFGVASGRRDENGTNGRTTTGVGRLPALSDDSDELEPTSFWASDFEQSGSLDAADADRPVASNSDSLWEAHTSADAMPVDPSDRSWQPEPTNGSRPDVDAPTERLPIYEAVLSQWFRADEVADESSRDNGYAHQDVPEEPPAPTKTEIGGLPTRVPGRAAAAAGFGLSSRLSGSEGNGRTGNGVAATATNGSGSDGDAGWHSPADEGWQRAEALLTPVSEVTTAGLPKRVPKAHLVPGSAGPRSEPEPAAQGGDGANTQTTLAPPVLPPRTADAVRGRMSSFQQGLRRGRHELIEAYSGGASHPSAHRADEEQE
ncbi:MAG TPA: nitrate- and nitrite sensing domain-containing protein [Pseudonocardiaceae bacterium]|nr:nitrate- and nitrite sensing domain-containing protein [Pseudonocardiaceae bacterium]